MKDLIKAGNALLERFEVWRQTSGDKCSLAGCECWNRDGGTIAECDDFPSVCNVCGEECECSHCRDLDAIRKWNELAQVEFEADNDWQTNVKEVTR